MEPNEVDAKSLNNETDISNLKSLMKEENFFSELCNNIGKIVTISLVISSFTAVPSRNEPKFRRC